MRPGYDNREVSAPRRDASEASSIGKPHRRHLANIQARIAPHQNIDIQKHSRPSQNASGLYIQDRLKSTPLFPNRNISPFGYSISQYISLIRYIKKKENRASHPCVNVARINAPAALRFPTIEPFSGHGRLFVGAL